MKILTRTKSEKAWKLVESAAYEGEKELQALLAESPSLISIQDVREGASPLVVAVREFPLPLTNSLDLLAFSANGDMTLIECKLASNPQIKREVIGQALEYGGQLWQMSYEDLDAKIRIRAGKPLAELMREALGETIWDEEAFRENVESALSEGSFILMIIVDQVTDELSRIIHFVNNCGRPAFSFAALEMRRFQSETTEMLVPRVIGDARTFENPAHISARRRWTTEMFFEDAGRKLEKEQIGIVKKLYEFTRQNASEARMGTGAASGSFTFILLRNNNSGSIFSVFSNGDFTINFGYMDKICNRQEIKTFRNQLATIPSFSEIRTTDKSYFTLKGNIAFSKPEYLEQLKEKVLEFKNSLV